MPSINLAPKTRKTKNDTERRQEREKIYNTRKWQSLRRGCLIAQPLCEVCLSEGRTTPAIDVHHRRSFMNYEGLERLYWAYNPSNLASLCKDCHVAVHQGRKKLPDVNNLTFC